MQRLGWQGTAPELVNDSLVAEHFAMAGDKLSAMLSILGTPGIRRANYEVYGEHSF